MFLLVAAIIVFCFAASFLFTAGIIYLISLCFGFTFTWKLAFGIWLILMLLKQVFSSGNSHRD